MYNIHRSKEKQTPKEEQFAIRLHRAKSWFNCAEKYKEDPDITYITLWIAFNSLYSIDDTVEEKSLPERQTFNILINQLVKLDKEAKIENLLWSNYHNYIRLLINNQYVFQPFWNSLKYGDDRWELSFETSKHKALKSLTQKDVETVLSILFDRLYCLRNQLMHGGATYESKVNRSQVKDGSKLLFEIFPIIIEILESSDSDIDWGAVSYPVINS